MNELADYILQFANLNKQQIDLVLSKASELRLKKKERYFSEAGKIPGQVGFILEGVIRGCYYNNKGLETTRCLINENTFDGFYEQGNELARIFFAMIKNLQQ